jgi:uncharacterized protein YndB with AHSA1/START domain
MKYNSEVVIDLPRQRVVELFDNPDNLAKWQPGLQSFEPLGGEAGQPGAKSRLVYDMNGRRVEMTETIVRRDLPDEFSATYEAKGVMNWIESRFYEAGPEGTRWVMGNEFKFSGLMMFMGIFMRGAIRKQTLEDMNRFKAFAEGAQE